MAPFIRVRAVKFERASITPNTDAADYYVAINIKECIIENGTGKCVGLTIYFTKFFWLNLN